MKIAVIGASGWLGGAIAREAVSRGHEVTAIGRDAARLSQVEGARAVVADLDDPESIVDAVRGSDVVVS
jgi:putative NADH-flavin reductase